MPELPEVETMVRGIRPTMQQGVILDILTCPCERKPLVVRPEFSEIQKRAKGERIVEVCRRAKRVVIKLESKDAIVFEPRMTGLVLVSDPPTQDHLRFELQLRQGSEKHSVWIWDRRGLGTLSLYNQDEFTEFLGPPNLGMDALEIDEDTFFNQLGRTARPIKVALLDQKLVAGVGNLYASEILHEASVSPTTACNQISRKRVDRIFAAMRRILLEAIQYEGSTLNDGTYRNALNQDGSYQNQHRVYAKEGNRCPSCQSAKIRRIVQSQRSTFFCPACQRR